MVERTSHSSLSQPKVQSINEIITKTYAWNTRKKQFTPRQLELATQVLAQKKNGLNFRLR